MLETICYATQKLQFRQILGNGYVLEFTISKETFVILQL